MGAAPRPAGRIAVRNARYLFQKAQILAIDKTPVAQAGEVSSTAEEDAAAAAPANTGLLTLILPTKAAQYMASLAAGRDLPDARLQGLRPEAAVRRSILRLRSRPRTPRCSPPTDPTAPAANGDRFPERPTCYLDDLPGVGVPDAMTQPRTRLVVVEVDQSTRNRLAMQLGDRSPGTPPVEAFAEASVPIRSWWCSARRALARPG